MGLKDFLLSWGMLFAGVLMNVAGVYLVKLKINVLGSVQFDSFMSGVLYFYHLVRFPVALLGGFLVFAAPLPYAIALSRMDLSVAYPLSIALNCLLILPMAAFFMGESISLYKGIGTGLIVVSLFLLYK